MPRCIICDVCDTAGSLSTTKDKAPRFVLDDDDYYCEPCHAKVTRRDSEDLEAPMIDEAWDDDLGTV